MKLEKNRSKETMGILIGAVTMLISTILLLAFSEIIDYILLNDDVTQDSEAQVILEFRRQVAATHEEMQEMMFGK